MTQHSFTSHSIIAEAEETFAEGHIPMELNGQTTSYFITRKPTQQEIENADHSCIHVHMTPTSPWEPGDQTVGNNEATLRACIANETESSSRGRKLHAMSTKDDEFSILNPTLAFVANPEPAISETASHAARHALQISRSSQSNHPRRCS